MKKYIPSQIEPKWQKKWKEKGLHLTDLADSRNKYYVLVELPYTSGDLHMGHWFTFTMGDILARFKKRQGFNVLFPNGFDAFGLPAENAAIKYEIHPKDWTYHNIERMRAQFDTLGASIDWTKTMIAADPKYYKWNQWIFLKMLEKGLAYRGKSLSNWCPRDQTVLANENVENGRCWRCGTEVVQKEIDQWFLKITEFADQLIWQDPPQADWPKSLRVGQNDWIGKSEGINIKYNVIASTLSESSNRRGRGNLSTALETGLPSSEDSSLIVQNDKGGVQNDQRVVQGDHAITCFTTRPDTNFGAAFIVLAPEHPLALAITERERQDQAQKYIEEARKKSELERKESREKTGVFTGRFVVNPLTGGNMPVWIADYVLISYGTGAVVGVPGHDRRDFEFAQKFKLPIKRVVAGKDNDTSVIAKIEQVQESEGKMINSGFLDGLDINQAITKMTDYLEEKGWGRRVTIYHLHDWSISRQRYWGTPIPVIYCDKCGTVPVPEKDLPVELPYELGSSASQNELGSSASQNKVDYAPEGKSPLATAVDWIKVECPRCKGVGRREAETMDTFVDSAWYFFRYLDPENDAWIFDSKLAEKWMPVDIYIGGPEHTLGHALYSRFFTMFFKSLGLIDFAEYAKKRVHHGTILGPDGLRMSKSKGNVVNPDAEVAGFGADAIRTYLMFLGPFDIVAAWNPDGINGVYHFLQRVWGLREKVRSARFKVQSEDLQIMHKTIKKVTEDLEALKLNTAIAALMEWLNHLSKKETVSAEEYQTLLLLLAPFAPHITEELWQLVMTADCCLPTTAEDLNWSIHQQSWPQFANKYLLTEEVTVAVQVNGKVRDILVIRSDTISNKEAVEKMALDSPKVQKFLAGKTVKKTVYIPGKVINLVVGS